MRAIIPVAGNGLRLRPITNSKPKVLIEVAGKPVLEHILENMVTSGIDELILIVGFMKDTIINWVQEMFSDQFQLKFVEQKEQLGLGHAIYSAKKYLDNDPIFIALGDEIFSRRYSSMLKDARIKKSINGAIGIKTVEDYQHYGMIELDKDGQIKNLIEKPRIFDGDQAIAGVYYLNEGEQLKSALEEIVSRDIEEEEYQLTDALQLMVQRGTKLTTFPVGDWYDCGRIETLLKSNQRLIAKKHYVDASTSIVSSKIIEPCYIGSKSSIEDCLIGPNVSIGSGVELRNCHLSNMIIESHNTAIELEGNHGIISNNLVLFSNSMYAYLDLQVFEKRRSFYF